MQYVTWLFHPDNEKRQNKINIQMQSNKIKHSYDFEEKNEQLKG